MKKHCRRLSILVAHSIGVTAMFVAWGAQAVSLGHSRVTSKPDQPLRIMVQLKEVDSNDLSSLTAQIAPLSAWQEAGLTPPVELSSLSTHFVPSTNSNAIQLWLQSPNNTSAKVLDVLVDIKTDTATQRHQVSVLQSVKPTTISLAPSISPKVKPKVTTPSTVTAVSPEKTNQLTIKKGQHLYQIVRKLRSDQYNDQQLMAALVQANPSAFIQNNMNLMRSGATLIIPESQLIASITPQQANQIYQTQLQQFDEYRQRIAKGQPPAAIPLEVVKETKTPAQTSSPEQEGSLPLQEPSTEQDSPVPAEPKTDRLELSSQSDAASQADQVTSTQQELAYTSARLAELESEQQTEHTVSATGNEIAQETESPLITQPIANLKDTDQLKTDKKETEKSSIAVSWLESNVLWVALGLLFLMVILTVGVLRAGHANRLKDKPKLRDNN